MQEQNDNGKKITASFNQAKKNIPTPPQDRDLSIPGLFDALIEDVKAAKVFLKKHVNFKL